MKGKTTIERGFYVKNAANALGAHVAQFEKILGAPTPFTMHIKLLCATLIEGTAPAFPSCACYEKVPSEYPLYCEDHASFVTGTCSKFIVIAKCENEEHPIHHIACAYGVGFVMAKYGAQADTIVSSTIFLDTLISEKDVETRVASEMADGEHAENLRNMLVDKDTLPN